MGSAFRPISGVIEVDWEWRPPSPKVLRHPAAHEPRESRVVFHETVHYWQQISQGFLAKMAEEDWQRLSRFESDGSLLDAGSYRREFVRRDKDAGFSARDLQESLARFWDVHVIGPHRLLELDFADPHRHIDDFFKEQYYGFKAKGMIIHPEHGGYSDLAFDMAMEACAGNYARPYQSLRERFNPVVTGTVFPLAGHFSLQTQRPVEVFVRTVEELAPYLERLPKGQPIHVLWEVCYPLVRDTASRVWHSQGNGNLMMSGTMIVNGPLQEHPVYKWIFSELDCASRVLDGTPFAEKIAKGFGGLPEGLAGIMAVDYCLSCPGDTTNRSFLVEWLAPPCVCFSDKKRWLLGELHRREIIPEMDETEQMLSAYRRQVAEQTVKIQDRWSAFRKAARGY